MKSLESVRHYYDLGFSLLLLHPKSKEPIESRWTSGGPKAWEELEEAFTPGMNVGVRLGKTSKVEGRHLAVIDCDVKSTEPKHKAEMEKRLRELFPKSAPTVLSGRGNGSRHLYVLTDAPASSRRWAQSVDKVKVFMPSAKRVSKYDKEHLTDKELKEGYRIRHAWEISLMGEGGQVVLPPSIHPDSGKPYRWKDEQGPKDLPLLEDGTRVEETKAEIVLGAFRLTDVDLLDSRLTDELVRKIVDGEGVSDRSASLLEVCNSLLKLKFSDDEILTLLTEPDTFLGSVAYEHAKTNSRDRAAAWVAKYTLEKSKRDTLAEYAFDDDVDVDDLPLLGQEDQKVQDERLHPEKEWKSLIERGSEDSGARPKNTLKNVILILQGEGGKDVFRRDEFASAEVYGQVAPWGSVVGAEVIDLDTVKIKEWLANQYRFEPSDDRINQAVAAIANRNRFHPVKAYLDRLEWDGVPRIDSWLKTYLQGEAAEPYLSAVSRKVLVALVARIYRPGVKFDQVLILEGLQGYGKSTALRNLVSDEWFTDATLDVADKDAIMNMRSIWLIEMGELSALNKASVNQLKEFISRTVDRIRVPYGRRTENFPRQCIFIGTTNSKEYLKDTTGNRRFWPVKVGRCDFKAVARDRDQLLAEAKFAYELGEPLYLEEMSMEEAAISEQEARTVHDSWEDLIADWVARGDDVESDDLIGPPVDRNHFRTEDLFLDGGPLAGHGKLNPPELKRVGEVLRKMGFENGVSWDKTTKRVRRFWFKGRKP